MLAPLQRNAEGRYTWRPVSASQRITARVATDRDPVMAPPALPPGLPPEPMLLKRLLRKRPARSALFWLALHIFALGLQWATVRAAPIFMQHENGKGWRAICVTFKGP